MALVVFLIMASYYVIKPVREALMLQAGGAEAKTYMNAVMAFCCSSLVQGYAKMVSRYERTVDHGRHLDLHRLFCGLLGSSSRLRCPYLGYCFFRLGGIFSVMVVAQFWSYANDVYSNEAGKRLFPAGWFRRRVRVPLWSG